MKIPFMLILRSVLFNFSSGIFPNSVFTLMNDEPALCRHPGETGDQRFIN